MGPGIRKQYFEVCSEFEDELVRQQKAKRFRQTQCTGLPLRIGVGNGFLAEGQLMATSVGMTVDGLDLFFIHWPDSVHRVLRPEKGCVPRTTLRSGQRERESE